MKRRMHTSEGANSSSAANWTRYLEQEIAAAAVAMESELGERSMCIVHKDGRVPGGLKYHEGRLSAFAEARRLARRHSDITEEALLAQLQRWSDELDRRQKATPPSMAWVSYATGGAAASREALEALTGTSP